MEKRNVVAGIALAAGFMLGGAAVPTVAGDRDYHHEGAPVDIVGTWKMTVQFTDCVTGDPTRSAFSALNSFFAEGNLIENGSGLGPAQRSISHGRWQQIGKRTVIARSELQLFESNLYSGYQVIQRTFTVSRDGNELTATGIFRRYNPADVLVYEGCATETGQRQPDPTSPPQW
jgi:hypothetical protein